MLQLKAVKKKKKTEIVVGLDLHHVFCTCKSYVSDTYLYGNQTFRPES